MFSSHPFPWFFFVVVVVIIIIIIIIFSSSSSSFFFFLSFFLRPSGLVPVDRLLVSDTNPRARQRLLRAYPQLAVGDNNITVAQRADIVVLAVKPQTVDAVLVEMRGHLRRDTVLVSIVAGKTVRQLRKRAGGAPNIARCMPNTPAIIGQSMTVWTCDSVFDHVGSC